jgi:hypothetical protein
MGGKLLSPIVSRIRVVGTPHPSFEPEHRSCIVPHLVWGDEAVSAPMHYLKKRDILWGPHTSPAVLSATAREYLQKEAWSDALDFFERAKDEEGFREIKKLALQKGDTFLLVRLERIGATWVKPEDWEKAKVVAEMRGIRSMAAFAERKLKPPERVQDSAAPGTKPLEETVEQA